jgi:hypothetical protein
MNDYPLDDNSKDYRRIQGLHPNQYIQDEVQLFNEMQPENHQYMGYIGDHEYTQDEVRQFQDMPDRKAQYAHYTGTHAHTQPRVGNPNVINYKAPNFDRITAPSHKYPRIDNNARARHRDPRALMMIILIGLGVIVTGIVVILVMPKSSGNDITTVQQPANASQVAAKLDCTAFKSADTGASGMVVSAGTCTKGGVKYAVDTFVSQDVRDNWLKAAEPLGVNPKWETATSVVYKSIAR